MLMVRMSMPNFTFLLLVCHGEKWTILFRLECWGCANAVVWQGQVRTNDIHEVGEADEGCVLGKTGVGGKIREDTFSLICGGQVRCLPFEGILAMP